MKIKTVILCGGQGTRIRDVAENIPKPMILIGDRPVLWHIMKIYAQYGFNDFVLCLGYKGWIIKDFFLNYHAYASDLTLNLATKEVTAFHHTDLEDWLVTMAETGEQTQTGGRIWKVRRYLNDCDLICITYGDGVADIDINQLVAFHRRHGRVATVTGVRPAGRFGVMKTEQQNSASYVCQFEEKPQTTGGWINGGFFVFDQRLWDYMDENPELIFEQEPLSSLAQDKQLVMYEHKGFWQPMDTFREWRILNEMWSSDTAPWRKW